MLPELSNEKRAWYVLCGYQINEDILSRRYYLDRELHRTDGPAIEGHNFYRAWYKNGKLHREEGPAIITFYEKNYYINGKELPKEEYLRQFVDSEK